MSQTLHQIYQTKAIVIARTMVVKIHSIATAINEVVRDAGYPVDEDNPASWKYYMNMFGEYHQYDHDLLLELSGGESKYMRIKVAGETSAIDANFSKELLFGDGADQGVANEYRFNTQYYKSLVSKYPEFEDLILGVLNPVSPELALNADEGEILYCGGYLRTKIANGDYVYVRQDYGPITENYLIEPNEENLIYILRDHIKNYMGRWWNINYVQTHELFLAQFIVAMTLTIPQILGNIRLMNARTPFVHSFFVRQHLESMGRLGWVCEYLSREVLLWLHRNVRWLDANRGKTKTFRAIIDNVLTPSNVKIAGYRLRHDVSEMDQDNLYPEVFMEKIPLNYVGNSITRNEIIDIVYAEVQLAIENKYNQEGQAKDVSDSSKYDIWDDLYTRVLESTMATNNTTEAVPREDIAMNMWMYTASHGTYRGTVIFTNPFTNERIQLTPLNAYILTFYCFNRGYANCEFEYIPQTFARMVTRHSRNTPGPDFLPKPTLADIRKGTTKAITDEEINTILGSYVPQMQHGSTVTFAEEVTLAYEEAHRKYMESARVEDAYGRGQADWVRRKCYWFDIPCDLVKTKTLYSDWLLLHGFSFNGYTRGDFITLGMSVVHAATGVDLNASDKLKNTQSALLAVLRHFSSYTVQIIQNNSNTDAMWLDNKGLRLTNIQSSGDAHIRAKVTVPTAQPSGSMTEGPIFLNTVGNVDDVVIKEHLRERVKIENGFNVKLGDVQIHGRAKLSVPGIVRADIPDVIIDNRVPKYEILTSTLYPMYVDDKIVAVGNFDPVIQYMPPVTKWKEALNATSTMSGSIVLHPYIVKVKEQLASTSAFDVKMVIAPPTVVVMDSITASASMDQVFTLITPSIAISDTLGASANFTSIFVMPEPVPMSETLTSIANISSVSITGLTISVAESLTSDAEINQVKVYFDKVVKFGDTATIGVGLRKGYIENNTILGVGEITKLAYVEAPILDGGSVEEE